MRDKLMTMNPKSRVSLLFSCFLISGILMFILNDIWFPFFVLMFFFLTLLISTNLEYDKKLRAKFDNNAKEVLANNNFKFDDFYIGDDKLSAIAINERSEKIAIVHRKLTNDQFTFTTIEFSNIIESSIIENGEKNIKVSKGSLVGGTVIGGILGGGIGAAIGGMNADKTVNHQIKTISLIIVANDLTNPVYEINFMNTINPIDKSNSLYKEKYSKILNWHKKISVIIQRNIINSNSI